MLLLPALVALVALGTSKPLANSEHQAYLEEIFGKPLDLGIVNRITEEEARWLGISAQEHLNNCWLGESLDSIKNQKDIDTAAMIEFYEKLGSLHFESVGEVMEVLKCQTPKFHAAALSFYQDAIENLSEESIEFFENLKKTLIQMLYNHVELSSSPFEQAVMQGKALRKIYAYYDALSGSTKADIERNTCTRTTLRIVDATGVQKGRVSEIKQWIKHQMIFTDY